MAEASSALDLTGLQAATPADHYAGPGDVECDFCTGRKCRAVKYCLVCLASYCETHLQPHYESPAFKKHKLADATGHLQDKVCSLHDRLLEVYCRTDQQCICLLCVMDEHEGHDTVLTAAIWEEMQRELQLSMKERKEEVRKLRKAVDSFKRSAVEDSEMISIEISSCIGHCFSEVIQLVKNQKAAVESQGERDCEELKKVICELKRRHSELEQLSHTEDHIHFLQKCRDLPVNPKAGFQLKINSRPKSDFVNIMNMVSELKDELESLCKNTMAKIRTVTKDIVLPVLVHRTRTEFLQYSCQLTLDPNTAHRNLSLSEGNRKVTREKESQNYDLHKNRFDNLCQVLCEESLTGRCYWEAEWSGDGARIGVTYKGIVREGRFDYCKLGANDKSWMLFCSPGSYSVRHNKEETVIPIKPSGSHRVGVYLDAGTLSFYRVSSGGLTHLYSFTSSFTEPLYPGFRVNINSSVFLCMLG